MEQAEKKFLMRVYFKSWYAGRLAHLNEDKKDNFVCDEIEKTVNDLPVAYKGSPWNAVAFVEELAKTFPQDGFNPATLRETLDAAEEWARKQFEFLTKAEEGEKCNLL